MTWFCIIKYIPFYIMYKRVFYNFIQNYYCKVHLTQKYETYLISRVLKKIYKKYDFYNINKLISILKLRFLKF